MGQNRVCGQGGRGSERTCVVQPQPVATHNADHLECRWRFHGLQKRRVERGDLREVKAVGFSLVFDYPIGARPIDDAIHVLHQRLRQSVRNDDHALYHACRQLSAAHVGQEGLRN